MKLESLTIRGFMTAFAGKQVEVDFTTLPPGLIALVGGNGEGKTTLLEAAPAGLYREMLSRTGDLKTYAMDRDSTIDSRWAMGDAQYHAKLTIDGIKGGSAAVIERVGAAQPLNDGKVSTYDPAIAAVFPPLHVFKASAFAAQNKSGSFVQAEKKDRRDIFASLLGIDRLVRMSEAAKGAAAEVDKVRVRVQAEIDVLERETGGAVIELLERQAVALVEARTSAERRRDELAAQIADVEPRLARLSDQVAAHAVAAEKVTRAAESLAERQSALQAHESAAVAHTAADELDRQSLVAAHVARTSELERQAQAAAHQAIDELTTLVITRDAQLEDLDKKLAGNQQIQGMATDIRAAVATIADLTPQLAQQRARLEHLRDEERAIADRQAGNARALSDFTKPKVDLERAHADAALLAHVPCGGQGDYAGCQLLVNAKAAEARIGDLTAQVAGLVAAVQVGAQIAVDARRVADAIDAEKRAVGDLERRLATAQPTAAYAEKLAASEARVDELRGQRVTIEATAAELTAQAQARHRADAAQRADVKDALDAQYERDTAAQVDRIARRREVEAATQLQLAAAVTGAANTHASAVRELDQVQAGHTHANALQAELASLRADRDAAVTAIATAASDAGAVAQRLAAIEAQGARVTALRGRLTRLDTELLEWQLLQKALDRDGLPALETDQAGPEISATTNQILADCFESRFSVELVTQVVRADGKGMKDEFTVLVTDNQSGDVRDISDLSGGEEVIVAEALMNAIAIYVNERSAVRILTLFRDETTGALTQENTQRYIQMLRKVQALGGFHQILFISHDPDAYALADAQLLVAGGTVTPMLPPYRVAA